MPTRLAVRPPLAVAFVLAASVAAAATNGRRPITETDLHRFVWIADPRISPDGRQVAFVRVTVNDKRDGCDTAIWMVPADASAPPRAFTSGRRDSYQPDDQDLFSVSVDGGEPERVLSIDG